jgi:thiol-disulfide isomerase/thioredoxin
MIRSKATIITIASMVGILIIGAITIAILQNQQSKRELSASPAAGALATGGTSAPYTDFDGNPADLDQYVGQVLVVHSWASWSPFSSSELQLLAEVAQAYAAEDVVVIAINRAEAKATAESYLRTIGVADQVRLIVDNDDRYYKSIGGYTMPETVFYDQTGNIIAHKRGELSTTEAESYIEQALAQQ